MKSVKRILGLILVSMMLMTMILPASADNALDGVTREAMTNSVGSGDATFAGEKLNLNFDGVIFTSSDSSVIDPATGAVTRPEQTKNVILTASKDGETKDFAFRIPGKFESNLTESTLYYNNFAGETKPNFVGGSGGSKVGEFNLTADGSAVDGKVKVEFLFKRSSWYQISKFGFADGNGKQVLRITWYGSDANNNTMFEIGSAESKGTNEVDYIHRTYRVNPDDAMEQVKVEATFDTNTGAITLKLNNVAIPFGTEGCRGGFMANGSTGVAKVNVYGWDANCNVTLQAVKTSKLKALGDSDYKATPNVIKHFEDFEGSTPSEAVVLNEGGTSPVIAESADAGTKSLQFTSSAAGKYYLSETKQPLSGQYKIEFDMLRDWVYGHSYIMFYDNADKRPFYFCWYKYGWSSTFTMNIVGNGDQYPLTDNRKVKVEALVDTVADTVTFSFDGVAQPALGFATPVDGIAYFTVNNNETSTVLEFDNIKVTDYTGANATAETNYFETFNAATASSQVELTNNMSQKNGKLTPTENGVSSANVYLREDKKDVTGSYTIAFNMVRTNTANTTDVYLKDASGKTYGTIRWWGSGTGSTYVLHGGTPSSSSKGWSSIPDGGTRLSAVVDVNTAAGTFSVTVNGVVIATNVPVETAGATGVACIQINNGYGATDASMYDVAFYAQKVVIDITKPEVSGLTLDFNAFDKKVSVLSGEAGSATVIAASYTGTGDEKQLLSVEPVVVTLAEDGTVVADTSALVTNGATCVVIYLWNNLDDMQPLCAEQFIDGVISAN